METKNKSIFCTERIVFGACYDPEEWLVGMSRNTMIAHGTTLGKLQSIEAGSKTISCEKIVDDISFRIMYEKTFLTVLYLLIVESLIGEKSLEYRLKKNKYYMCKVWTENGGTVVIRLVWIGDKWRITSHDSTYTGAWFDPIFLYF